MPLEPGFWDSPKVRGREGRQGSWGGFPSRRPTALSVLKQTRATGLEPADTVGVRAWISAQF